MERESLLGILLDGIDKHELKGGGNIQEANIQVYRGAKANGKLSFVTSLHWGYQEESNKSGTGRMNKLMLKISGRFLWVTCENENDKRETRNTLTKMHRISSMVSTARAASWAFVDMGICCPSPNNIDTRYAAVLCMYLCMYIC
jgi:hypothetical protein